MNQKKHESSAPFTGSPVEQILSELEHCTCQPLSHLHKQAIGSEQPGPECEEVVTTSSTLNARLRKTLQAFFPRSTPISIFLLHISQWERTQSLYAQTPSYARQHYHISPDLLEQVIANVRRVMRANDQLFLQENFGIAIIFPDVDQQGAYSILERIYHSICLLQAETLIPPLSLDTTILMGMGTYPEPGNSLEQLLYFTGIPARRFTLRPAITTHLKNTSSTQQEAEYRDELTETMHGHPGFPFMHLPSTIAIRLQHLIPYPLALELHCAPVGRDHHCLTVAMADPGNNEHIQRLQHITGLTIYPVSCNLAELHTLLAKKW